MENNSDCSHLDQILEVTPDADQCSDCIAIGDIWVHLRMCMSCGHVACCDSSKNTHATKHFQKTNHAIISSRESGESWLYCYIDEIGMMTE